MRGTWRPKRVGIAGKPHGGQGRVEVGIELDYGEDVFEADDMVEWEGKKRDGYVPVFLFFIFYFFLNYNSLMSHRY